ncbi:MAG TPA: PilN domain-containing protein [Kofleriaceae bacterium]|nr:PilN domain-containing protein [Kofleriaceae bacterium]
MIKINLLPAKRAKLRVSQASEGGQREMAIGIASLVGAAALVFFVLDQPKRSRLKDVRESNDQLQQEINAKNVQLQGFAELDKAATEASERARSINRLIAAKVVPANVLQELGEILTTNHLPTMTQEMARRTGNGPESDPNRRYDLAWDPTHVWLTSFVDKGGTFKLEGGAQAEGDITQLSKRMQASVYFDNVAQASEERQTDHETGVPYYKFMITGKVAY